MSEGEWRGILRSLVIYWRPGRQRALRRLYAPFVSRGDLVFDVGAHLGDRTAAFAGLGARVVALEPQPAIARWLRRLVGRRRGVEIVEAAVGRAKGTVRLAVSARNPTVSSVSPDWRAGMVSENPGFRDVRWNHEVEVPMTTLDELIARYGTPSFCKLDIEGFEAEALAGLSRPVPGVSVEFVKGGMEVARACVERLEALGTYRYNAVAGETRSFLFDVWTEATMIDDWLRDGAGGTASGDLYARLEAESDSGASRTPRAGELPPRSRGTT